MAINKDSYNTYVEFPELSYNCISYLVDSSDAEILWRLLKYNDNDAWRLDTDHPNLTKAEKGALIYSGEANDDEFRVFLDIGADTAVTKEMTTLRVSPLTLNPSNYVLGRVVMSFEIYSHFHINTLSNKKTRTDMIVQNILKNLNGQEVDGIGRLAFNQRCRMTTIGKVPYKGRSLTMTNWLG